MGNSFKQILIILAASAACALAALLLKDHDDITTLKANAAFMQGDDWRTQQADHEKHAATTAPSGLAVGP